MGTAFFSCVLLPGRPPVILRYHRYSGKNEEGVEQNMQIKIL